MTQQEKETIALSRNGFAVFAMICVLAIAGLAFVVPNDADAAAGGSSETLGEGLYSVGDFIYAINEDNENEATIVSLTNSGAWADELIIPYMEMINGKSRYITDVEEYAFWENTAYTFSTVNDEFFMTDGAALYKAVDGEPTEMVAYALLNSDKPTYVLPATVTNVYPGAIYGYYIRNISVEAGNTVYASDGGVLYTKDYSVLVQFPAAYTNAQGDYVTSFEVKNDANRPTYTIGPCAFSGVLYLQSITLSEVYHLCDYAFSMCPYLEEINFEFEWIEILYRDPVKIDAGAFAECYSLKSIDFSTVYGELTVGNGAFADCDSLSKVVFGEGVTKLNYDYNGDDVVGVFSGCTGLTDVILGGTTYFGEKCFAESQIGTYVVADACEALCNLQFNGHKVYVSNYAFAGCTSLEGKLELSNIGSIGAHSFEGCTGLTYVSIVNDDYSAALGIGSYAFAGCTGIKEVSIGAVKSVAGHAFYGCSAIETVTFENNTVEQYAMIGVNAFCLGTSETGMVSFDLYSDHGWAERYMTTSVKGQYTNVNMFSTEQGTYKGINWIHVYETATLKVFGTGSSVLKELPADIDGKVFYLEICSGIKSIEPSKSYTLPANHYCLLEVRMNSVDLETIGDYAFYDMDTLESVFISKNIRSIGEQAFFGCVNIKTITFEAKVPTRINFGFDCFDLSGTSGQVVVCNIISNGEPGFLDEYSGGSNVILKYNGTNVNDDDGGEVQISQETLVMIAVVAGLILIAIAAIFYVRSNR